MSQRTASSRKRENSKIAKEIWKKQEMPVDLTLPAIFLNLGGIILITRKCIIEYEANEIYLDEKLLEETDDGDIDSILNMMYRKNGMSPLPMTWELTNKCNFDCPFCYIHNHSNTSEECIEYKFEEIKSDLDELIKQGLFICNLTGGECLLHPDFEKIYLYLKKQGVLVTVLTNADLLSEKHISIFKDYKPYKVEVSIYGKNLTFSSDTTVAKKVLENVLKLKNAGINVVAKIPFNSCTERQFEKVQSWYTEHDIDFYYSNEIFSGYDGTDNSIFKRDKKEEIIQSEQNFGYKKVFDCSAGKYSFILSYNKKVRPCFAFYEQKAPDWAFDTEKGLSVAFNRMKYKIELIKGKRLMYCNGCEKNAQC